ncbi:MAG: ArsA family ATPase [Acidimicrobiales bacterium]
MTIRNLVESAEVIVCTGPGGVGKTTTAAAIGMAASMAGRKAVVITVDPARRLADALAAHLGAEPTLIVDDELDEDSNSELAGELWAMTLDPGHTFDALVREHASKKGQAEEILANAFYQRLSRSLGSTQEYMAAEALHLLHHDERFDLVVVDTPPAHHALALLDAPQRLTKFLTNRLYRTLVRPTGGLSRLAIGAARGLTKRVASVVGGQVLDDALGFFEAFSGMEDGFAKRASEVTELLASDECQFVIVATPDAEAVATSQLLGQELSGRKIATRGVVLNLTTPDPWPRLAAHEAELAATGPELRLRLVAARQLHDAAAHEVERTAPLEQLVGEDALARVPRFINEIHDRGGLRLIAKSLTG